MRVMNNGGLSVVLLAILTTIEDMRYEYFILARYPRY